MATRLWLPADCKSITPIAALDATDASTLTNNSGALGLASGFGSYLATNGASGSPAVVSVNNAQMLDYTGGKSLAVNTTDGFPKSSTSRTIVIIARAHSQGGTQPAMFAYGSGNGGAFYVSQQDHNDPNPGSPLMGVGGSGGNVNASSTKTLIGSFRIIIGTLNGATGQMDLYVDGEHTTATPSQSIGTNNDQATLGYWTGYGDHFPGEVAIVFLASGIVSQDERWRLESFYGYRAKVPDHIGSDNPYAGAAPTIQDTSGGPAGSGTFAGTLGTLSASSVSGAPIRGRDSGSLGSLVAIAVARAPDHARVGSTIGRLTGTAVSADAVRASVGGDLGAIASRIGATASDRAATNQALAPLKGASAAKSLDRAMSAIGLGSLAGRLSSTASARAIEAGALAPMTLSSSQQRVASGMAVASLGAMLSTAGAAAVAAARAALPLGALKGAARASDPVRASDAGSLSKLTSVGSAHTPGSDRGFLGVVLAALTGASAATARISAKAPATLLRPLAGMETSADKASGRLSGGLGRLAYFAAGRAAIDGQSVRTLDAIALISRAGGAAYVIVAVPADRRLRLTGIERRLVPQGTARLITIKGAPAPC